MLTEVKDTDNNLKHLFQEFSRKCLKSVKQKGGVPLWIHSQFSETSLPDKNDFCSCLKDKYVYNLSDE